MSELTADEKRVMRVTQFIASVVSDTDRFGRFAFDCRSVTHDGIIVINSPAHDLIKAWLRLDADFSITSDDTNELHQYLGDNDFLSLDGLIRQGRTNHDVRIERVANKLGTGC